MGDLSPHFSSGEFRCRDGSEHPIDCRLIAMLESVRCHFDVPVTITSGYRSPEYNAKVNGAKNSYHTRGMAADFIVVGVPLIDVYAWCDKQFPVSGLGRYKTWIHLDSRMTRARWGI